MCALRCRTASDGSVYSATELKSPYENGQRLTAGPGLTRSGVMLQHNSMRDSPRRAHLAHAAVVSLHAICCGLPALAMLAAAVSGATSGIAVLSGYVAPVHRFLHGHEVWILGASAGLVLIGGWLEARARRHHKHGFPWLFAFSVFCFVANVAIIVAHRAT